MGQTGSLDDALSQETRTNQKTTSKIGSIESTVSCTSLYNNSLHSQNSLAVQIVSTLPITCYVLDSVWGNPIESEDILQASDELSPYTDVPRSASALAADHRLADVKEWHTTLEQPCEALELSDAEYDAFMRYCSGFVMIGDDDRLWRKDQKGNHKVVVAEGHRLFLLATAHNDVGHHEFYATNALLTVMSAVFVCLLNHANHNLSSQRHIVHGYLYYKVAL